METVHAKAQGSQPEHTPKTVIGPLTVRDVVVIFGGLLVLVGSFIPIPWSKNIAVSLWIFPGLPFHLFVSVLLPLAIAAGFLWRRLQGRSRMRVGSLSLDQAGSVVAIIATAYFFNSYVASMAPAYLIGLLGALAMLTGTTLASYLGAFRGDFVAGGESVLGSDVYPVPVANKENKDIAAAAEDTDDAEEVFGASSAGDHHVPSVPRMAHTSTATSAAPVKFDAPAEKVQPLEAEPLAKVPTPAPTSTSTPTPTPARAVDGSAAEEAGSIPAEADLVVSAAEIAEPKENSAASAAPAQQEAKLNAVATKSEAAPEAQLKAAPVLKDSTPEDPHGATPAAARTESVREAPATPAAKQSPEPKAADVALDADSAADPAVDEGTEAPQRAAAARLAQSDVPQESAKASPAASAEKSDKQVAAPAASSAAQLPVPEAKSPAPNVASGAKPAAQASAAAHPATSFTEAAPQDIKATAALSRADIEAHQKAAEQAKAQAAARAQAESELGFGARAEVQEPQENHTSFWFALNAPRPVYHPGKGNQLATLQPGTWILCLEDRGTEYLINQPNGTPAVLRNLDDLQFPEK